mmetsp:Transcript_102449/g.306017  ORF Transcript_102449/g.306017 Transcript_102449/m.306017 type:complete len:221 (+) Transcript_102449:1289-1951(+)
MLERGEGLPERHRLRPPVLGLRREQLGADMAGVDANRALRAELRFQLRPQRHGEWAPVPGLCRDSIWAERVEILEAELIFLGTGGVELLPEGHGERTPVLGAGRDHLWAGRVTDIAAAGAAVESLPVHVPRVLWRLGAGITAAHTRPPALVLRAHEGTWQHPLRSRSGSLAPHPSPAVAFRTEGGAGEERLRVALRGHAKDHCRHREDCLGDGVVALLWS